MQQRRNSSVVRVANTKRDIWETKTRELHLLRQTLADPSTPVVNHALPSLEDVRRQKKLYMDKPHLLAKAHGILSEQRDRKMMDMLSADAARRKRRWIVAITFAVTHCAWDRKLPHGLRIRAANLPLAFILYQRKWRKRFAMEKVQAFLIAPRTDNTNSESCSPKTKVTKQFRDVLLAEAKRSRGQDFDMQEFENRWRVHERSWVCEDSSKQKFMMTARKFRRFILKCQRFCRGVLLCWKMKIELISRLSVKILEETATQRAAEELQGIQKRRRQPLSSRHTSVGRSRVTANQSGRAHNSDSPANATRRQSAWSESLCRAIVCCENEGFAEYITYCQQDHVERYTEDYEARLQEWERAEGTFSIEDARRMTRVRNDGRNIHHLTDLKTIKAKIDGAAQGHDKGQRSRPQFPEFFLFVRARCDFMALVQEYGLSAEESAIQMHKKGASSPPSPSSCSSRHGGAAVATTGSPTHPTDERPAVDAAHTPTRPPGSKPSVGVSTRQQVRLSPANPTASS
jgi:hypothetical protein